LPRPPISPARAARLRTVVDRRQLNWVVILENVHDWFNLSAVMRSCDAVGIQHVFVLQTEEGLRLKKIQLGQKSSGGTRKWLDVHYYRERAACFEHVRSLADKIYATHLGEASVGLHELDMTGGTALLFGNEHDGLSHETLAYADANFTIPMYGITQSLNISVACAVSLYEGLRQRQARGQYVENPSSTAPQRDALFQQYLERNEHGKGKFIYPSDSTD